MKQKTTKKQPPEKLFPIKDTWNFDRLYTGITDPEIEKDIRRAEKTYIHFSEKYNSPEKIKEIQTQSQMLRESLDDWNRLLEVTSLVKPLWYLHLLIDIDSNNSTAQALQTKYTQRLNQSANLIVFYNLALGSIAPSFQKQFLSDPLLAQYRTYLVSLFEVSKFNLSEKEEKLIGLLDTPAHSLWVSAQKKYLSNQQVKYKNAYIPITEASNIKANLPLKARRALHKEITSTYQKISFFAEAELNAIITHKHIIDDMRGFQSPYESTVLAYQNSVKSVENLISTIEERYKVAHEFFKIKAQVLGLPKLTLAELGTNMSRSSKTYTIGESVGLVYEAFKEVDPFFSDLLAQFAQKGQIDFRSRKGKRNGAYCSSGVGVPTYIFLNHSGEFDSVSTLAHEMGHAIHSELSKSQPAIYEDYTISIAEIASTFFENILFDYVYHRSSPADQKAMLLEHIQNNIFTIYSQVSYFNFEKDLHLSIKEKGSLTAKEIADKFLSARKKVFGPQFEYTPEDGYGYVAIPHFRSFFYVYAYAYGQLIANAFYAEYKKDPAFIKKVKAFLSAGGSMKPDDVCASIGIDVTSPDFFKKGLDHLSAQIAEVKKLCATPTKKRPLSQKPQKQQKQKTQKKKR